MNTTRYATVFLMLLSIVGCGPAPQRMYVTAEQKSTEQKIEKIYGNVTLERILPVGSSVDFGTENCKWTYWDERQFEFIFKEITEWVAEHPEKHLTKIEYHRYLHGKTVEENRKERRPFIRVYWAP